MAAGMIPPLPPALTKRAGPSEPIRAKRQAHTRGAPGPPGYGQRDRSSRHTRSYGAQHTVQTAGPVVTEPIGRAVPVAVQPPALITVAVIPITLMPIFALHAPASRFSNSSGGEVALPEQDELL
jgi:hypothetical protein